MGKGIISLLKIGQLMKYTRVSLCRVKKLYDVEGTSPYSFKKCVLTDGLTSQDIADISYSSAVRATLPYIALILILLVVITYVPDFVLYLPNLIMR